MRRVLRGNAAAAVRGFLRFAPQEAGLQRRLSGLEVWVLAEQNVPHHKPAKDCRSSESRVWGSELDSKCRDRRGGKINGSSESFSKAAFLPKGRHIRVPPSPRAMLYLPRARLARWPPGSRQFLRRRRHDSATFVAARIRSLFEPVHCVRISRNPTARSAPS